MNPLKTFDEFRIDNHLDIRNQDWLLCFFLFNSTGKADSNVTVWNVLSAVVFTRKANLSINQLRLEI